MSIKRCGVCSGYFCPYFSPQKIRLILRGSENTFMQYFTMDVYEITDFEA